MPSETVQLTIVGAPGEEIEIVLRTECADGDASASVVFRGVLAADGTVDVVLSRTDLARSRILRRPGVVPVAQRVVAPSVPRTSRLPALMPSTRGRPIPAALLARQAEKQLRRTGWPHG